MSKELKRFHEQAVDRMGIPDWALFNCPFCSKKLSKRSIRNICMLFNARNIGDIAVEFCCEDCSRMDTMYFRKAVNNTKEFAHLVDWKCYGNTPEGDPIIEEKMYKMQYNNLVEKKFFAKEC